MKKCIITTLEENVINPNLNEISEVVDFSVADSYNLVISASNGQWVSYNQFSCKLIEVNPGSALLITNNNVKQTSYTFLKEQTPTYGSSALFASGSSIINIEAGGNAEATVPLDAVYLYVLSLDSTGGSILPDVVRYNY